MPTYLSVPAAVVAVALAVAGCAASDPTPQTSSSGGLARLQPVAGRLDASLPGDPFDRHQASIRNLDPDLLDALEAAARDAQDDGVHLVVTSGWRSRAHQQRLLDEAIREYGSEAEARRYVSTPDTSAHVTGHAVDIGPTEADDWLSRHGAAYGLCQVFANEIWHYELATTPGGRCPEMYPDSSYR